MATITTPGVPASWAPDVSAILPADAIPAALVNQITTVVGAVEGDDVFARVPVVLDDPAGIVPEGDPIPESDPDLSERVVTTVKVAKLIRLSREMWSQRVVPGSLADSARRAIITAADTVLVNQAAPTPPAVSPPPGLLHQGITDAGTVADDLDGLVDALAAIRAAGGDPSHFVLSPTAWASLSKFKVGTGSNATLLGSGAAETETRLLGLQVLVNAAVPSGSGLVVSKSDIVSAVGPVRVATSDQVYFSADSVAVRVTFRFGASVVHAGRHALFEVTAP